MGYQQQMQCFLRVPVEVTWNMTASLYAALLSFCNKSLVGALIHDLAKDVQWRVQLFLLLFSLNGNFKNLFLDKKLCPDKTVTQFWVSWQQWYYMICIIWGFAGIKATAQQTKWHCQWSMNASGWKWGSFTVLYWHALPFSWVME